jgi:hypothetical protein
LLKRDRSQALRIHGRYNLAKRRFRGPRILLALLWWPVVAIAQLPIVVMLFGGKIKAVSGKGRFRQALEQFRLLARHGLPPFSYYTFEFHDDTKYRHATDYVHRWEMKSGGLYKLARQCVAGPDRELRGVLGNKSRFFSHCQRVGLPTIPVLAEFEAGEFRTPGGSPASLPRLDLFVKPSKGKGGRDVFCFEYLGDGRYRDSAGRELSGGELVARLKRQSRRHRFLVQPRLRNHPEIADLGGGALTTLRIVSVRDESGSPEVAWATFRVGGGEGSIVDNLHQGGLACAIDTQTGRMGSASRLEFGSPRFAFDPQSGKPLAGRRLPLWDQAQDLAVSAHCSLPNLPIAGWDIALTAEGVLLVEGNAPPCVVMAQKLSEHPLGSGRFGELLLFHLERAGQQL